MTESQSTTFANTSETGHRGYVASGRIEYEFDDGRRLLTASEGEAFFLPKTRRGQGAHRGRNSSSTPTRLFLIDDSPDTWNSCRSRSEDSQKLEKAKLD